MQVLVFINIFFFFTSSLYSQLYIPVDTLTNKNIESLNYFNLKTKDLENEFKSFPVNDKRVIKRFRDDRKEMFKELTKDNYLFYDEEIGSYVNGLLQNIAQENGINAQQLRLFMSRDTSPNAFSLGDGSFVITLSLLHRLDNEEELIFILAHELSHYYLDHLKKQIRARMLLTNSSEYKNKQRELNRSKYNKFSKSLEDYRELQYGNNSTRRLGELEADSLGLILFKKVAKNPQNAINALKKLDTLSPAEILKIDLDILKNHFSTTSLPFNEVWTSGYDFSKYNYQKGKIDIFGTHKDSLKSHPQLEERVLSIKKIIPQNHIGVSLEEDNFIKLKEKISFEDIYAHYCLEEYGRGIYLILQLQNLENVTENQQLFYSYMLSLFYEKLANARKSFMYKRYVDDINYLHFSNEYMLFLTILDNLRSSELQELSNKYSLN